MIAYLIIKNKITFLKSNYYISGSLKFSFHTNEYDRFFYHALGLKLHHTTKHFQRNKKPCLPPTPNRLTQRLLTMAF